MVTCNCIVIYLKYLCVKYKAILFNVVLMFNCLNNVAIFCNKVEQCKVKRISNRITIQITSKCICFLNTRNLKK